MSLLALPRRRARLALAGLTTAALVTAMACAAPQPTTTPSTPAPAGTAPAAAATTAPPAAGTPAAKAAQPVQQAGKVTMSIAPFTPAWTVLNTGGSGQRAQFYWPVFDGLTWVDRQGVLQPALAARWNTPDAVSWTFTLRDDIKFHDGTPLEAADVLAAFDYFRNPDNRAESLPIFADVTNVTAPDNRTIAIQLRRPVPAFGKLVALAPVVKGRQFVQDPAAYMQTSIGTGPYRFRQFQERSLIAYEAMPPDFVTPRGVPTIKELEIRDIPEVGTATAALLSNSIQIAYPVNANVVAQIRQAGGYDINIDRGSAQNHVAINMDEPQFQDVRVRQAMNHAVNRQVIVDQVLGGLAEPINTMIGDEVLGYDPSITGYAYDVARAQQLMAAAGQAQGFQVPMRFSPAFGTDPASALAADLARINVRVELQQIESALWSQEYRAPQAQRPGLYVGTTNWEQTFEADVVWRWWSSDIALTGGRRWTDETFDRLYQTAKATVNDQERGRLYQQAGRYLSEQAPVIFLWRNYRPGGVRQTIEWQPGLFADSLVSGLRIR